MAMLANTQQQMVELQRRHHEETTHQPSRSPVDSSLKEPKANDPETFYGKPNKLRQFIQQCNLVFRLQPSRFASEEIQVAYMTSYLRGSDSSRSGPSRLSRRLPPNSCLWGPLSNTSKIAMAIPMRRVLPKGSLKRLGKLGLRLSTFPSSENSLQS